MDVIRFKFCLRAGYHFRGDVDSRHGGDLSGEIIGYQYPRTAGDIEDLHTLFYAAIIEDDAYYLVIADMLCVS